MGKKQRGKNEGVLHPLAGAHRAQQRNHDVALFYDHKSVQGPLFSPIRKKRAFSLAPLKPPLSHLFNTSLATQATPSAPHWSLWLIVAAILAVWLSVTMPMATGENTFFYRDVTQTHLPAKTFGAEMLRRGKIPTFNPHWGLGQPFRGNPGSLPFYPGNLLYLVLPTLQAFNLHYCLHWLLAGLTMTLLARRLGMSFASALMAALTYFGSGWMLTNLTFYNLITVAAWWPAVMAFALTGGRRGTALAGLCCGMALLGGGPILAALGLVPLLMVAVTRHGWRRGTVTAVAVGAIGMVIALPQVIATARVLAFSVRGGSPAEVVQVSWFVFHPLRLLELILPLPLGWHGYSRPYGIWNWEWIERTPYYLSIHQGLIGLWLAAVAARRRWSWALLAAGSILIAASGRPVANLLTWVAGGLFRYPEKFLFWFALAIPLGAGWGLERVLAGAAGLRRAARWVGGVLATLGLVLFALRPWAIAQVSAQKPGDSLPGSILAVQMVQWGWALVIGGTLLVVATIACRAWPRWAPAVVLACQGFCLLQLHPLLLIDSATILRQPSNWAPGARAGDQVVSGRPEPAWTEFSSYLATGDPRRPERYQPALSLASAMGITRGLGYPLAHNGEGLGSVLRSRLQRSLIDATWRQRANWLRTLGVKLIVLGDQIEPTAGLRQLSAHQEGGKSFFLYAVDRPAPVVRWPRQLLGESRLSSAVATIGNAPDPLATLVLSTNLGEQQHDPTGNVALLENEPDRVVFEVDSLGGVVALRRSFHPLLRAWVDDEKLPLFPADVFLTGITVPPGKHRVVVEAAGSGPEVAGGIIAVIVALGCLWLAWSGRGASRRNVEPGAIA